MTGKAFDKLEAIDCHSRYNRLVKARRDGRWWMLKGLKPEYESDALMRELLRKEFNLGMLLRHQGIVGIVSLEQVPQLGGGLYIVQEWVEGVTLKQWLAGTHTWREKVDLLQQLCLSLDHCHRLNVVHRDIKPSNIMVTPDGRAVLIDMGLAVAGNQSAFRAPAGTERYMAPEQRHDGGDVDGRADLWAVGCIMQEMALPRRFGSVRHRLLQRDRDKRYPDAQALHQALTHAAGGGRRQLTWGGAAVLAAVCALAAFVAGSGQLGNRLLGMGDRVAPTLPECLTADTVNHWMADTAHFITLTEGDIRCTVPKVTCPIPGNIPEGMAVDLGLSVLWAPFNVGCDRPSLAMPGGFYGYGDTTGQLISTDGKNANLYWNVSSQDDYSGTEFDIATVHWGGRWRTPRMADMDELLNRCQWTFVSPGGTPPGYLVIGPNGNRIFLPLAGFRYEYDYYELGQKGLYWVTVPCDEKQAANFNGFLVRMLVIEPGLMQYGVALVPNGFSVRPVLDRRL